MKYKISCSFGEIIDKITILKLKKEHTSNLALLKNINNELNSIYNDIQNYYDIQIINSEKLTNLLYNINKKLWNYEDKIRNKSKKKQFDKEFIETADNIHRVNDLRHDIKNQINKKYKSC